MTNHTETDMPKNDTAQVDIATLANLARVRIDPTEAHALAADIGRILGFVKEIENVSTHSEKEPRLPAHHSVMRSDESTVEPHEYTEALIAAAPERNGNYLSLHQVITGGKHADSEDSEN
jgi:aspartyl/glutamyl-tRNA(Asn/Gln) amidotransferase C subunit